MPPSGRPGLEFENEPDINFIEENPETHAAFQKACYLGVRAADQAAVLQAEVVPVGNGSSVPNVGTATSARPPGDHGPDGTAAWDPISSSCSRIEFSATRTPSIMGHADDFTRVYRQFENAVTSTPDINSRRSPRCETGERRSLSGTTDPRRHYQTSPAGKDIAHSRSGRDPMRALHPSSPKSLCAGLLVEEL